MKRISNITNSSKKYRFLIVLLDEFGDDIAIEVDADSKEEAERIARKIGLEIASVEQVLHG
jgi:hypothetical protein